MDISIISVGGGGHNLACGIKEAGIFSEAQFVEYESCADMTIGEITEQLSDTVVVCATLGGKTGSRYAPLIALEAIMKSKFVCSVVTMPFAFEGKAKWKRASCALYQIMCSSNLRFIQHNNELEQVPGLMAAEIDKPLIETLASVLENNTLQELAGLSSNHNRNTSLVPERYRLEGYPPDQYPLISIAGDAYPGISITDRERIFK